MTITVFGIPGPQGSKSRGRYGQLYESSKKVKPWREACKYAALEVIENEGLNNRRRIYGAAISGPVEVEISFSLPSPQSRKKIDRYPSRKPDIDKLLRSTFDGLSDIRVWEDDARVVRVLARKLYVGEMGALESPGAFIIVNSVWVNH